MDDFSDTNESVMTSSNTYSTTIQTRNGLYDSYVDTEFNENDSYNKIFKLLLKSCIPKILSSSASLWIITVNIIWLGHHSTPSEFAGALLALTFINISLHIAIASLTTALDKFFNYSYRSQLYKMVGAFVQRSIIIIHIIMILLAFLLFYTSENILIHFFGQTHSDAHHAYDYIQILIVGFWPFCMLRILCKYIESFSTDKHNIFIFIALLIAVLFELPFLYLLLDKYSLGIKGGAIALIIAYWSALASLYIIGIIHPNIHENILLTYPGCGHWIFNAKEMKIYLRHSLRKSLYIIFETCMLQLFVFIAGKFDTEYLCAYVISLNILQLFQQIPYGISISASLIIKDKLYNADRNAARQTWNASVLLNIISICLLTAIMLYFSDELAAMYTKHDAIVDKVTKALPFTCLYFCFESLLKCFIAGMHGLHREGITAIIHVLCYYCFGFPLGIIFGYKGFLSIEASQFKHVNGLWLGACFGIFVSLCIFILIRTRIKWSSEIKRSQKLLDELENKIERFRNRVLIKYGRYSNYGIHSSLIEDDLVASETMSNKQRMLSSTGQQYEWTVSGHLNQEDDAQRVGFVPSSSDTQSGRQYYYDIAYKQTDNETLITSPINIAHNYGSALRIPINDLRMAPFSAASSMARSIPQSVGPPSRENAKHGPIVL